MSELNVLYDASCGLCERFRLWLGRQPSHVQLRFIPLQSPDLDQRFPGVRRFEPERELVVIDACGYVYQGPNAWVMCLWATREYRALSHELARPAVRSLVRKVCGLLSANRLGLSKLMGLSPARLEIRVDQHWESRLECTELACSVPEAREAAARAFWPD